MSTVNFGQNVNFNKNEAFFFVAQKLGADPSSPVQGQIYYNTNIDRLKMYTGGSWLILEASTGSSTTITDIVAGNQIAVTVTGGVATIAHAAITGAATTNFTGASVLAGLTLNNGHITGITTRNLTLANLGYTGAVDADKYTSWSVGADIGTAQTVASAQAVTFDGEGGIVTEMKAGRVVEIRPDSTFIRTTGDQTAAGNKTFTNNVVVNGNLTVNGTTTTVNSTTVEIADNILLLNKGAAAPSKDAGFLVDRGSGSNKGFMYVEALNAFVIADFGSASGIESNPTIQDFENLVAALISCEGLAISAAPTTTSPVRFYVKNADGVVAEATAATVWDAVKTTATTSVAGISQLATNAEALAMSAVNRVITPSNLAAFIVKQSIGNGTDLNFTVTHNFDTLDVEVTVFDNVTGERVYTGEKRNLNNVVIAFGTAPTSNQYRVLIRKV
jgi:hypothetical protein